VALKRVPLVLAVVALAAPLARGADSDVVHPGFGVGYLLLTEPGVQKELGLSEEQVAKVHVFTAEQRAATQEMRGASVLEKRDAFRRVVHDGDAFVEALLRPEQAVRLRQILRQQSGLLALHDPEVAAALKLGDAQRAEVRHIEEDSRKAFQDLFRQYKGDRAQAPRAGQDVRRRSNERLVELFTPEQRAKWKELVGEPFTGELRFLPSEPAH
jgi:hypothetical protein